MAQFLPVIGAALFSVYLPQNIEKNGGASSKTAKSNELWFYSVGIATGISLGAFFTLKYERMRIKQRFRIWLRQLRDKNSIDAYPKIKDLGESSVAETLLNTQNSLSRTMHCYRITLAADSCLQIREAKTVELYYVLKGTGIVLLGDENTVERYLYPNDYIIINESIRKRSVLNRGNKEDLVFLRIADYNSAIYDREDFEKAAPIATHREIIDVSSLKSGLQSSLRTISKIMSKERWRRNAKKESK
mmetsp:Transcript_5944/g.8741  ORF Transcript_5944/g.8741 Transcript_5944/m.8741 type:complete len:246 (-) Transcript_5944:107-844(-)